MATMIFKYEICERSTHDGYISLGINNKYNMIGSEIIGEFCCRSVGDRTFMNDVGDKTASSTLNLRGSPWERFCAGMSSLKHIVK